MSNKPTKIDISDDIKQGYQEDSINLKAIIWFSVVLSALIIFCFGLIWYVQYYVLEPNHVATDQELAMPMDMNSNEQLPPEPRLQAAPGFGVDGKDGRESLELMEPQAEWHAVQEQYKDIWENGEKDGETIIAIPIEQAKKEILKNGNIKANNTDEAKYSEKQARDFVTDASAGRLAAETIR